MRGDEIATFQTYWIRILGGFFALYFQMYSMLLTFIMDKE